MRITNRIEHCCCKRKQANGGSRERKASQASFNQSLKDSVPPWQHAERLRGRKMSESDCCCCCCCCCCWAFVPDGETRPQQQLSWNYPPIIVDFHIDLHNINIKLFFFLFFWQLNGQSSQDQMVSHSFPFFFLFPSLSLVPNWWLNDQNSTEKGDNIENIDAQTRLKQTMKGGERGK